MKPRVLLDIKRKSGVLSPLDKKINLASSGFIRVPVKPICRTIFVAAALVFFVLGFAAAPTGTSPIFGLSRAAQDEAQRKALEAQLVELEREISDHEAAITRYKAQGNNLRSEIKRLETQVAKLNLQIRAIDLSLADLDQEISQTRVQISRTEVKISDNKDRISQILQIVYENDKNSLVEVLLAHPNLSDFFGDLNNLVAVQDNLRSVVDQSIQLRQDLLSQNQMLAVERSDNQSLKEYEDAQRQGIKQVQQEKTSLLEVTKGKESEYQKLVQEKKKTAAQIRQRIFQLLGGGEMQFSDAYELAKLAEKATGVPAAFLLAVLDRESALGKNVGQCDYKTAMNPRRDTPIFLELVSQLGLQNNLSEGLLRVSCANADGAYGGAMGPAQFIPSTWILYADRAAALTGNNPPSPWNNADAFMATALYLKDAGGDTTSITKQRTAAAKYYAGARWRRYLWTYGDRVVAQAQQFADDISVINS